MSTEGDVNMHVVNFAKPADHPVVRMVQKVIASVDGEKRSVIVSALMSVLVLMAKHHFAKDVILKGVERTWETMP